MKEGNHVLLGAETAQALPNNQLYYAFIRGAGKQYGVHWFGNASVFNRWGWKDYGAVKRDGRYVSDPEEGTSLSLVKRLLYTHYLYNCVMIGFESGWLTESAPHALTPIGAIQRGAVEFVARHGQPGVMHMTGTASQSTADRDHLGNRCCRGRLPRLIRAGTRSSPWATVAATGARSCRGRAAR